MKIVKAEEIGAAAVAALLKKAPFDQVELSPAIRAKNRELYGEDLTASQIVDRIVTAVRQEGDAAVIRYTGMFDGADLSPADFLVSEAEYQAAAEAVDPAVVASMQRAIANVRSYHVEQKPKSWMTYREHGSILGQSVLPLDRVGIYVPGGTAAYPSSVIMNAVPAMVAGVGEIVMMVPASKEGKINPYVLVAAKEIGVQKVYKIGGAQVSELHTNFIVNAGKATSSDIRNLVSHVQKTVFGKFGIELHTEIKMIGEF